MIGFLGSLVKPAIGLARGWLDGKQKLQASKQRTERAVEERRAQQAREKGRFDSEWELEQLKQQQNSKANRANRTITMLLVFSPVIVTVVSPDHGRQIWENLKLVPGPYWGLISLVMSGIWAQKNAAPVISKISQALGKVPVGGKK